jgi:hypothetical protein
MKHESELTRVLAAVDPEEAANDVPFQTWSPMPFGRPDPEPVKQPHEDDEPLEFLRPAA